MLPRASVLLLAKYCLTYDMFGFTAKFGSERNPITDGGGRPSQATSGVSSHNAKTRILFIDPPGPLKRGGTVKISVPAGGADTIECARAR